MKKKMLTLAMLLLVAVVSLQAQTDSTVYNMQGLPSSEEDQAGTSQLAGQDVSPKEDRVKVETDELPEKVKRALQKGEQYKGWESAAIYLDKNTNLYLIHINNGTSTRTYGLNDRGKPVTINAVKKQN